MQENKDAIVNAGIRAEIGRRMGFDPEKVVLLESNECGGFPTLVVFEVCGQGYGWNIYSDTFFLAPAHGTAVFGERL